MKSMCAISARDRLRDQGDESDDCPRDTRQRGNRRLFEPGSDGVPGKRAAIPGRRVSGIRPQERFIMINHCQRMSAKKLARAGFNQVCAYTSSEPLAHGRHQLVRRDFSVGKLSLQSASQLNLRQGTDTGSVYLIMCARLADPHDVV